MFLFPQMQNELEYVQKGLRWKYGHAKISYDKELKSNASAIHNSEVAATKGWHVLLKCMHSWERLIRRVVVDETLRNEISLVIIFNFRKEIL